MCNASVAHGGRTTILRSHIHPNYSSECLLLHPPEKNSNSFKADATQSRKEDFDTVPKPPATLMWAKMLTEAVADLILKI